MNGPRFRAWRFLIPGIEAADELAGVSLTPGGAIEMVEGHESIRQAIVLLLSTVPGERVMRPDYGCDLRRLVFSPNDETTAGLAIYYVRRALERWEPRVLIERLDAVRHSEDPEGLEILLEYRVRATRQVAPLALSVDLGSGTVGSVEGIEGVAGIEGVVSNTGAPA
jgi:phage baseplate assembly protein W